MRGKKQWDNNSDIFYVLVQETSNFFYVLGLPIISRLYIDLNPLPIVQTGQICVLSWKSKGVTPDRCHDSQQS